jgi:hypothetical protein
MVGLGVGALLLALKMYPSEPAGLAAPPFTSIIVTGPPLADMQYSVDQGRSAISEVSLDFQLRTPIRRPARAFEKLEVDLPPGPAFLHCDFPVCMYSGGLADRHTKLYFDSGGHAAITFGINARSFNVASNGVNASVAFPDITYHISPSYPRSHRGAVLHLIYRVSSADNYDWSALPPINAYHVPESVIEWDSPLSIGHNPGRVAVGINYGHQASNNTKTFIAGALIALAGAAGIVAVQELFHIFFD